MNKQVLSVVCVLTVGHALACEEEKEPVPAEPATLAASALKAAEPQPVPSAAEPTEEEPARPTSIDTEVTAERRAAVEKAYPQAKGFVVAKDIEELLKANKAVKEEANAVKGFDAKVKGKWVLFAGTMVNLTEDGFDIAIVYTPQLPNDPMGMSRQFFTVTLSDVEGYDESKFKVGNTGVVLAKYSGDKQASPGFELVETGNWK